MNTEKEDNCELCLVPQDKRNDGESEKWTAADIFAPHDAPVNTDMPTPEQKAKGNKRLAAANAHREQKVRNWSNPECERFLGKKGKQDRRSHCCFIQRRSPEGSHRERQN